MAAPGKTPQLAQTAVAEDLAVAALEGLVEQALAVQESRGKELMAEHQPVTELRGHPITQPELGAGVPEGAEGPPEPLFQAPRLLVAVAAQEGSRLYRAVP